MRAPGRKAKLAWAMYISSIGRPARLRTAISTPNTVSAARSVTEGVAR
jgi:hypothetical protein